MRAVPLLVVVLLAGCFGDAPVNEPSEATPPWFMETAAQRGATISIGSPEEPEGRQGSIAVGDVNQDGYPDLYIVHDGPNVLLRNRGDGTFEDITAASGTADVGDGHAALFLDLDNDGRQDLLVANRADPSRLFRNAGFGFEDVTKAWNVPAARATSLAAADIDNDGDLDVVMGTDGGLLGPSPDLLLRNNGTFDVKPFAQATRTHGLVFCDMDMDGDPDLLAAGSPSLVWTNGKSFTATPAPEATGVLCADLNQDARPDVYWMSNDPREPDGALGLAVRMRTGAPLDADGDGDLDIVGVAALISEPDAAGPGRLMEQVHVGTFADLASFWGNHDPSHGRAVSAVDIDVDGDLDVIVATRGALRIYENVAPQGGLIHLLLEGTASNRDGIGTKVWGEGDETRYAEKVATQGSSQTGALAIVGEDVRIQWPSGTKQTIKDVAPGTYRLVEGGKLESLVST